MTLYEAVMNLFEVMLTMLFERLGLPIPQAQTISLGEYIITVWGPLVGFLVVLILLPLVIALWNEWRAKTEDED